MAKAFGGFGAVSSGYHVEVAVVRLLAERGEAPPAAVEALDRFRAAIASGGDVTELVDNDIDFHRALAALSRSPRLRRLHRLLALRGQNLRFATRRGDRSGRPRRLEATHTVLSR